MAFEALRPRQLKEPDLSGLELSHSDRIFFRSFGMGQPVLWKFLKGLFDRLGALEARLAELEPKKRRGLFGGKGAKDGE